MNEGGELYGEPRLKASLSTAARSVRGIVARVADGVWQFQGDAVQADDVTAMAVAFHGAVTGTASHVLELRMVNKLEDIGRVIEEFGVFAAEHGLDDKPRRTVNMALDELLNNVVSYAYDDDGEHWIDLRIELPEGFPEGYREVVRELTPPAVEAAAPRPKLLGIGDAAPEFSLTDSGGKEHRLSDLREEVDNHLSRLKRQSRAAERYKKLKQERRELEGKLLALQWHTETQRV